MTNILKNKEVRRQLKIQSAASLLACTGCFVIDVRAGLIATALALVLILSSLAASRYRYKKIRDLAYEANKALHGDNAISLEDYSEGELGILHSEIYKMTVRLREQQQNLMSDKKYLADSIADISHQIRTPLTSINLLVQLLSQPDLSEERRLRLANDLYSLLSRIDWLITTLLKMSAMDAGTVSFKKEQVPLEALLRKACAPLLAPIELREQELKISAEGCFLGDMSWTCEAVGNIVKNCMEHTPRGGNIEIEARETALYSEIIIKDSGKGISGEDMPHIFERFYKGKDSDNKNFGVGLALSKMIITNQNGTIKVENGKPSGAVFSIRFYKGIV